MVAAMGQHTADAVLQRYGCGALRDLACGDAVCKQAVVDGGGGGGGGGAGGGGVLGRQALLEAADGDARVGERGEEVRQSGEGRA